VNEKSRRRLSVSGRQSSRRRLGDGNIFWHPMCRILHYSREVMFLDEDEMVVITSDGVVVSDLDGMPVQKR